MDSLFSELKRRKVIRIATAYIVGAWVLLQVSDVVSEPLGFAQWVQTVLIWGLIAFFPVAVILGWVFELTGKGIIRDPGVPVELEDSSRLNILEKPSGNRLAVLPLNVMGDSEDDSYLGEGIAEEIINVIAPSDELEVVARTSSFRFRGTELDMEDIRTQLQVTHILTGSIQRSGKRIRITAQLIDAATESQLWSDNFQRDEDDVFKIQSEVASHVSNALVKHLGIAPVNTANVWTLEPEAYELYLMARSAFWRADFLKALELTEKSSEIDSKNPLVPTLIAEVFLYWPRYGFTVTKDNLRKASRSASNALEIDSNFPAARAARGMISLFLERDYKTAFNAVVNASTEQPGVADWIPLLLGYANRYKDAVEIHRRIAQRDPLNAFNLITWANRLNWIGKHEEAMKLTERTQKLDPRNLIASQNLYRWTIREGDFDGARAILSEWGINPDEPAEELSQAWLPKTISLWLGSRLYGEMGDLDKAYELAAAIEKEEGFTPTTVSEAYINAGAVDDAYRVFDIGINQYDPGVYDLARPHDMRDQENQLWQRFRQDPRFEEFLERLGIDDESLRTIDWDLLDEVLD